MKKVLLVLTFGLLATLAFAEGSDAKAAQLKSFVDKAVTYYLANATTPETEKKVFEEFSDPKGPWVSGEFYLYLYDFQGKCVAHGAKKTLIGVNLITLKDSDGVFMIKEIIAGLSNKKTHSQNFKFPNPAHSGKIENKVSLNVKVQSKNMPAILIGSGYYK